MCIVYCPREFKWIIKSYHYLFMWLRFIIHIIVSTADVHQKRTFALSLNLNLFILIAFMNVRSTDYWFNCYLFEKISFEQTLIAIFLYPFLFSIFPVRCGGRIQQPKQNCKENWIWIGNDGIEIEKPLVWSNPSNKHFLFVPNQTNVSGRIRNEN